MMNQGVQIVRKKRWTFVAAVVIILGSGLFAALAGSDKSPAEAAQAKSVPVKTLVVRAQENETVRSFPGKVRASKRVTLAFDLDGVLVDLPITEGGVVRKGQLLAKLDPRDYENNLRSAKAKYTEAKQNFERAQKLLKEGVIPQANFENAQSAVDTAQAQMKICEKALEDTELRAPFDGAVAKRFVQNHQRIDKKEDILSLQNSSTIEIVIQVPESVMAATRSQPLQGRIEALFEAIPDKKFPVRVQEFRVDADNETRTYEVVLEMPAPAEHNILPGMTAAVLLSDSTGASDKAQSVWWIPKIALLGNAQTQESFLYCVDPATSRLKKKAVSIGAPTERGIPVLSGLNDGDEVVIAGSRYLHEGQLVRPVITIK